MQIIRPGLVLNATDILFPSLGRPTWKWYGSRVEVGVESVSGPGSRAGQKYDQCSESRCVSPPLRVRVRVRVRVRGAHQEEVSRVLRVPPSKS